MGIGDVQLVCVPAVGPPAVAHAVGPRNEYRTAGEWCGTAIVETRCDLDASDGELPNCGTHLADDPPHGSPAGTQG